MIQLLPLILLIALSACGPQLANTNWAGLSTDGRRVYLAGGTNVLSFDTESKTANWIFPSEPQGTVQFYSAPSTQGDQVIFGDYGQAGGFFSPRVTVSVYKLEDRGPGVPIEIWRNSAAARDKIVAPTLQVDERVYVATADNHVLALNTIDGSVIWDIETRHANWGAPSYQDGVLYVASMDWSIYALNAETGETIWETRLGGALPSRPVLGDGLVYVSSFDGNVHALDIATGELKWSAPAQDWVWGAPALADGSLYFSDIDGNLIAVDANTGAEKWQIATDASVQTSPLVVDDTLYVASEITSGSESSIGALTAYSVVDGSRVWQTQTTAPLYTNPVIVGGDTIVIAMQTPDSLLVGYDMTTGQERWRYTQPATN